jgi:hypothetical protein
MHNQEVHITPWILLKVNRRFGGTELCLPTAFTQVSCSTYSSTLKMNAICSSETSVDFKRNTRRYIPEDNTGVPLEGSPDFLRLILEKFGGLR